MSKTILTGVLTISIGTAACAQTFDEWFRQKETQKEYLIQQNAALKVYLDYLKKGYDICEKGLNTIGDIKDGKFHLDRDYLGSLKNVNLSAIGSGKVASIVAYQRMIMAAFRKLQNQTDGSDLLTANEKQYVKDVYANVLRESENSVEDLDRVLSSSDFEMKDDERIQRVGLLYADLKDKYEFTRSFSNSTNVLIMQRSREMSEVDVHRKLTD